MQFNDKNTEGVNKEITLWDFLEQTGAIESIAKRGVTINPIHNFHLLKSARLKLYSFSKSEFSEDRKSKRLETSANDYKQHYNFWLKNELLTIEGWLSDYYPNGQKKNIRISFSDRLEILKYRQFIQNEIDKITGTGSEISESELELYFSLTTEEKYEYAFKSYKEKFSDGNEYEFQQMEIKYQQQRLKAYEANFSPKWYDTKLSVEAEKLLEYIKTRIPQQAETKTEQQTDNDFTLSTIEDWLYEFKVKMNETDYQNLVSALIQYFETGEFPILSKPIQINGRLNKKLLGWALNRIFEAKGKRVEKELLLFAKHNISLFANVQFDESNILKSNLYKYFTTQTK